MVNVSTAPTNPLAAWRTGVQVYDLVLTKPGHSSVVTLATAGVDASWAVSGQTRLSAEVNLDEVLAKYQTTDLRSYWLTWEHPALGSWGGEVQECEPDTGSGTMEVGATDYSALLEASTLPKVYDPDHAAPAGAWVRRLLTDARREGSNSAWLLDTFVEEVGEYLKVPLRGGSLLQAFRTLETRSGDEWHIDASRKVYWQKQRGQDQTWHTLHDGVHIFNVRPSLSLQPIINALRVVPADEAYAQTQTFTIRDDASIDRYGKREGQLTYTGMVTESTLRPVALKDLARLTKMGGSLRFDCANVENCFTWFSDGDTITLCLPQLNLRPVVRILARSFDSDRGLLSVSGSIERMAA